jgi:hypothetical protein
MSLPPGVPALLNVTADAFAVFQQVKALAGIWDRLFGDVKSRWGIYLNGTLALEVTGFISFDFEKSTDLATYRIQDGAFSSFNKTENPYIITPIIIKEGTEDERSRFLDVLDRMVLDTNIYDVVIPEHKYPRGNLVAYNYAKSAKSGMTVLIVQLVIQQVLSASLAGEEQPQTQDAQPVENNGLVSAIDNKVQQVKDSVLSLF